MYKAQQHPQSNSYFQLLKTMMVFLFVLGTIHTLQAQQPFVGKLTYRVEAVDTNVRSIIPADTFQVYTNDTLVRMESRTSLGQQVSIRHLVLNKSYILLYFKGEKLAIQTHDDSSSMAIDTSLHLKYIGWKRKSFGPYKAHRALVKRPDLGEAKMIYYIPGIRPDLLNVYEGIKGLPVIYYLQHQEGIFKYELIDIDTTLPEKDRFGIPSDFEKITLNEFMNRFQPSSN